MAITRHQYRIYINAPIERVWDLVVDPQFANAYLQGNIEVCEPPHRLVIAGRVLHDAAIEAEPPSRVEWTLTSAGEELTQLDLTHGDLALSPLTWAHVKDGWVWQLGALKTLLETGTSLPPIAVDQMSVSDDSAQDPAGDWHRTQGIECNNSVWELIDKADRRATDNEEMLRRAYASAYHWQRAARRGPENEARGLWMLSKVQLLVGNTSEALRYADLCMAQCQSHGLVDFDLAYAYEVQARALQALGSADQAAIAWAAALAVPIADPEDKAIVDADLAVGP